MNWKKLLLDYMIWPLTGIVFLAFAVVNPRLLTPDLIKVALYATAPFTFLVLAEGVVLLSGNIDLSIGQMTGLIAMASAHIFMVLGGISWGAATIFVPLALGAACGALNGFLVAGLSLNPLLATLGTYWIFYGLTSIISGIALYGCFPDIYLMLGSNIIVAMLGSILATVILWRILSRTRFGYNIYSTGGDRYSADMVGVRTRRTVFYVFLLAGILCGVGAIAYTGFVGAVPPSLADDTLLPALAAAVIGGISVKGGRGIMINVLGGAFLLKLINIMLISFAVSTFMRRVIFGIVVILAILINRFRLRIQEKLLVSK